MSDVEESELAGYDVTLETTGPAEGAAFRRERKAIGAIPYEWLVSIRILLGKYFRGCLDCGTGRCGKCVQAERWMTRLDYHLAGAKKIARARRLAEKEDRLRVEEERRLWAALTPEERAERERQFHEEIMASAKKAYEADSTLAERFKKLGEGR